ncbi:MFS transporter, partial [Streptomyces sp. ME02-6987-2C]|nr:MFS transporter [Streptomyces sp. ME02-6987-2C]
PAGVALRRAAGDAFVHGLHVTLVVSAGLLLLGAVMALRLPRAMQCEEASVPAPRGAVDSPSRVSV